MLQKLLRDKEKVTLKLCKVKRKYRILLMKAFNEEMTVGFLLNGPTQDMDGKVTMIGSNRDSPFSFQKAKVVS